MALLMNQYYSKILRLTKSKIFQGASIAFAMKIVGAGASLVLQIALARFLNLDDYGRYIYIMAWIGLVSGFTSLGFNTSLIRYIPEYLKNEEYENLKGVLKTSIVITFVSSAVLATIGLVIILILDGSRLSQNNIYLYIFGIFIGLSFTNLFSSVEKGKKNMFMAHVPALFRHVFIGFGILLIWFLDTDLNFNIAIVITFYAIFGLVGWHLIVFKKGVPKKVFDSNSNHKIKEWLKVSLPLVLISGFLMILNQTDVIMLGILSTKAEVGIYNVAYKIATLTSFILMAVNAIAAPTISELFHQGKMNELQIFAKKVAHLIFWPTLIITAGIILFSSFILSLFGKEFIDGKLLLFILLVGQLVNALVGSVGYYLNLTGHERDSAKVFGIAALINIILNPIGIYFYGAVGAAVVTSVTTSLWNVWLYFLVKNKVGIKSSIIG